MLILNLAELGIILIALPIYPPYNFKDATKYVSYSLLGGQLAGNIYINYISNIYINYYKLLNGIATMVLKYMKFTCPTNRKQIHV